MKRIYKKVFKKPYLGSIHGPGLATSTGTRITSTIDIVPSIPASYATANAQVAAVVSVSLQLRRSHFQVLIHCYRVGRS